MVQRKKSQSGNREAYHSQVLEEAYSISQGAVEGDQGRLPAERERERETRTGNVPLEGSLGRMLWGFQTKARLVNPNQKEWGFGQIHGNLI